MITKIRDLEVDGHDTKYIAMTLGVDPFTVRKYRLEKDPRGGRNPLDEELVLKIKKMRLDGATTKEICESLNVSRQSVYKYAGHQFPRWEEISERVIELEEQGIYSRRKQASVLGVSYNALLKHVGPTNAYKLTIEDLREIRRLYYAGVSTQTIADDYKISRSTVYNIKNRRGNYKAQLDGRPK
jgi:DNA invertase Pin-like site-specific DNA recombinase